MNNHIHDENCNHSVDEGFRNRGTNFASFPKIEEFIAEKLKLKDIQNYTEIIKEIIKRKASSAEVRNALLLLDGDPNLDQNRIDSLRKYLPILEKEENDKADQKILSDIEGKVNLLLERSIKNINDHFAKNDPSPLKEKIKQNITEYNVNLGDKVSGMLKGKFGTLEEVLLSSFLNPKPADYMTFLNAINDIKNQWNKNFLPKSEKIKHSQIKKPDGKIAQIFHGLDDLNEKIKKYSIDFCKKKLDLSYKFIDDVSYNYFTPKNETFWQQLKRISIEYFAYLFGTTDNNYENRKTCERLLAKISDATTEIKKLLDTEDVTKYPDIISQTSDKIGSALGSLSYLRNYINSEFSLRDEKDLKKIIHDINEAESKLLLIKNDFLDPKNLSSLFLNKKNPYIISKIAYHVNMNNAMTYPQQLFYKIIKLTKAEESDEIYEIILNSQIKSHNNLKEFELYLDKLNNKASNVIKEALIQLKKDETNGKQVIEYLNEIKESNNTLESKKEVDEIISKISLLSDNNKDDINKFLFKEKNGINYIKKINEIKFKYDPGLDNFKNDIAKSDEANAKIYYKKKKESENFLLQKYEDYFDDAQNLAKKSIEEIKTLQDNSLSRLSKNEATIKQVSKLFQEKIDFFNKKIQSFQAGWNINKENINRIFDPKSDDFSKRQMSTKETEKETDMILTALSSMA